MRSRAVGRGDPRTGSPSAGPAPHPDRPPARARGEDPDRDRRARTSPCRRRVAARRPQRGVLRPRQDLVAPAPSTPRRTSARVPRRRAQSGRSRTRAASRRTRRSDEQATARARRNVHRAAADSVRGPSHISRTVTPRCAHRRHSDAAAVPATHPCRPRYGSTRHGSASRLDPKSVGAGTGKIPRTGDGGCPTPFRR